MDVFPGLQRMGPQALVELLQKVRTGFPNTSHPDYPPAAEREPHGASTGVTTGGYLPQALAVATRLVICLIFLNTGNREKVLGASK